MQKVILKLETLTSCQYSPAMKKIDLTTWNRRQHYQHFLNFLDPYFGVTVAVDVTSAYNWAKSNKESFFVRYLHDCMKAINDVENLRLRIVEDEVIEFDQIHCSTTIAKPDGTFGMSWIVFSENYDEFKNNFQFEQQRTIESSNLLPETNGLDCIHCSALPWFTFIGHKEPISGVKDSVPKLGYSKTYEENDRLKMNIAINLHHGLADGRHVGKFVQKFQRNLNS